MSGVIAAKTASTSPAAKLSYTDRTICTFSSLIGSSALRAGDDKPAGSAQVAPERVLVGTNGLAYHPRAAQLGRAGRSVPTVVSGPCPGCTTVRAGRSS